MGLVASVTELYPEARWRRCVGHFYRNVFSVVPKRKAREGWRCWMRSTAKKVASKDWRSQRTEIPGSSRVKLKKATTVLGQGIGEILQYVSFPDKHWRHIRAYGPFERVMREIRRRRRLVGSFPDGNSAVILVTARLCPVAAFCWEAVGTSPRTCSEKSNTRR